MTDLPSLSQVVSSTGSPDSPLAVALSTLFEPSAILVERLVPELSSLHISSLDTYSSLIGIATSQIISWDVNAKAAFITAHPRIGEVRNLSHLSEKEQATHATPPKVLTRLAHLNAVYEKRYPGLRYITFVNGRSRAEIKDEMENKLEAHRQGGSDFDLEHVTAVEVGSSEWTAELERAIGDVGKIAKARLVALGVA